MTPLLQTDSGEPIRFEVEDPFIYPVEITPADIDEQGHVNNAVYVRWMDRAAYAHSASLGYGWDRYQALGTSFVVRRHEIDYLSGALLGERIVVATWPGAMQKASALRHHRVVRLNDGQLLARAVTTWAYVNISSGRPQRIPTELIEAFRPRA